ncbi:glycosyltransferase [bacterium]|nr:glycosyltransferase [bacterium]
MNCDNCCGGFEDDVVKILHVVQDLHPGGLELLLERIVRGSIRRGHMVHVICLTSGGAVLERLRADGVSSEIPGIQQFTISSVLALRRAVLRFDPDLVHAHAVPGGSFARAAVVGTGIPVLYHLHTEVSSAHKWTPWMRLREKVLGRVTGRIAAVSDAVRQDYARLVRRPTEQIAVLSGGVPDLPRPVERQLARRQLNLQDTDRVILQVAGLHPHKGHATLLRALSELQDVRLLLAGDGPLAAELKQRAAKPGIENRVRFLGFYEDTASLYAAADVTVLASSAREGLGLTLVESFRAGVPCVGTTVGGIGEVIESGRTGLLVPPDRPADLAKAIRRLLDDEEERVAMGRRAREHFEQRFELEGYLDRLSDVYRDMLNRGKSRSEETPLRVLYLSLFPDFRRGGQNSLLLLLRCMRERHSVRIAVVAPSDGPLGDAVRELGGRFYVLDWPRFRPSQAVKLVSGLWRFYQILRDLRPDIIHADAPRNAHLAALLKGAVPLVTHLRVANPDGFSDRLLAFESRALIAVSRGAASRFASYPESVRRKVHIIFNAVDIERFHPRSDEEKTRLRQSKGLPVDRPVVLMLSAYVPFKRHRFFLDVWSEVVRRRPDALLVTAGQDGGLEADIRQRVEALNLTEQVRFLPFDPHPEDLLVAGDLLVLPSGEGEGFPRVVVEAGACGMPAVVSDLPAVGEGVVHGVTGARVEWDNSEAWVEELLTRLDHPAQMLLEGRAARRWVVEHASAQRHVDAVFEVYRGLMRQ